LPISPHILYTSQTKWALCSVLFPGLLIVLLLKTIKGVFFAPVYIFVKRKSKESIIKISLYC
jgi:hypothetical protein